MNHPAVLRHCLILLFFCLWAGRAFAISGDPPDMLEPGLGDKPGILFFSGYEAQPWTSAWGMLWGPSPSVNGSLVPAPDAFYPHQGNALQVQYHQGIMGPPGGFEYLTDLNQLGIAPRESLYLRYYVRFEPGFYFMRGGKLPGLCGGNANTGGHKPNGTDGWSARIMWRPNGRIVQYVYYPDQADKYGDDFNWDMDGKTRAFIPGKWQCVETYVQLNDPGKSNGFIRSWLDGEPALEVENIRFRTTPNLKIDKMYFDTFFGGNDPSWAPIQDEKAWFDDFVISDKYIGPFDEVP